MEFRLTWEYSNSHIENLLKIHNHPNAFDTESHIKNLILTPIISIISINMFPILNY
jgi:hypothetical protein